MIATIPTNSTEEGDVITLPDGRGVSAAFYRVRTLTFCIVRVHSEKGIAEFFDFAKCHTKDRHDNDIGERKALGRALARTSLSRAERLYVVDVAFSPF